MVLLTNLDFRLIGDEGRYHLRAIDIFATENLLEAVADYPSASTPLPYVLWAGFGRVFGFEVWKLRLLNALVTYAAAVLFYRLAKRQGLPYPLVCAGFLLLTPYVFFHGFTVYTVSFGLLFGVWALHYYLLEPSRESDLFRGGVLATLAVYSRQYYLFLPVGMLLCELGNTDWSDLVGTIRRRYKRWVLLTIPLVAFAPLALYWHGLTPPQLQQGHFVVLVLQHLNFLPVFVGFYFLPALFDSRTLELWKNRRMAFLTIAILLPVFIGFPIVHLETAAEVGAGGGIIPHGFDIVAEKAGRPIAAVGWFGLWLLGVWIILAEISSRPWSRAKSTLVGMMTAFMLLVMMTPYVFERYYTATIPLLILLLYRSARDPRLLWGWLVFLAVVCIGFSYWQIELKSMEPWGIVEQDWFQVIKDLPD